MRHIIPFIQLPEQDPSTIGTKAEYLGRLTKAKFNTPKGFVIPTNAFSEFISEAGLKADIYAQLEKIDYDDMHSIDYASRVIIDLIISSELPASLSSDVLQQFTHINTQLMAVRSSVSSPQGSHAAWAGELPTFLNISITDLLDAIKRCWAGFYSTRALSYRHKQKLAETSLGVAIIVQPMVPANVSGRAYSQHPVTNNPNQALIEAYFGISNEWTGSKIKPDAYILAKDSGEVLEQKVQRQEQQMISSDSGATDIVHLSPELVEEAKLTSEQAAELLTILKAAEAEFKGAVELEWALLDEFYILQARII